RPGGRRDDEAGDFGPVRPGRRRGPGRYPAHDPRAGRDGVEDQRGPGTGEDDSGRPGRRPGRRGRPDRPEQQGHSRVRAGTPDGLVNNGFVPGAGSRTSPKDFARPGDEPVVALAVYEVTARLVAVLIRSERGGNCALPPRLPATGQAVEKAQLAQSG